MMGKVRLVTRRHLLFFLALSATLALAACGGSQPDAQLEANFHDFGSVPQFDIVTVDIPLRNTGSGVLQIGSVTTSCGCTSASVGQTQVEPGGETLLSIRYDSGLHPDSGPIYRTIFVETNDPNRPELEVEVVANVVPTES
jgi:hypothetical protein